MELWQPGRSIVLREIWDGRVWAALPATVVQDHPAQRMLFIPPGTRTRFAAGPDGREVRLYTDDWTMAERVTTWPVLSFSWPRRDHAVLAMWDEQWRFQTWYVNLETTLRRTPTGLDFIDHCLDVIVAADRSTWWWKDEDELDEAIDRGLFSPVQAAEFRREGEEAARRLMDGEPPFDRDWSSWRPNPGWPVPALPPDWNAVGEPAR